jgi:integrase
MRGHIKERSPGHFAIVLDTLDPVTGKRKRKWHSFKGTKRGAQIESARLISERQGGSFIEANKITFAQHLGRWLDHVKSQIAPRTHERYSEIVRNNIIPAIGAIHLTKLRPVQISDAYIKALASGRRDGKGGLSPNTVVYLHRLIKQALSQAVRWELINRNPADAVKPPKVERKVIPVLDTASTANVIESARSHPLFIPILLGTMCGLRRGEMTALRWCAVDLDRASIAVVLSTEQTKAGCRDKEPKQGRSRNVALPSFVVDELRRHRLAQAERLLRFGVRVSDNHHVVAQPDGRPYQPRSLTQAMRPFMKSLGSAVRLHGTRHSHATHMLLAGVHPKIASERLGHSKVGITLDLYSHVLPGMQEDAASRVDDALRLALQKRAATAIR